MMRFQSSLVYFVTHSSLNQFMRFWYLSDMREVVLQQSCGARECKSLSVLLSFSLPCVCATTDGSCDSARRISIQSLLAYAISTKSKALAQIVIINRVSKET